MISNRFDIAGKVVVITGGGQGIGREYALAFAEAAAVPIVAELDEQNGQRVVSEIEEKGGEALAVKTDVTSEEAVRRMVNVTMEKFGRIDILINNAALFAVLPKCNFADIPLDEWNQVLNVNITGSYLCAKIIAPIMRKAGNGRIINVSSGTVPQGAPGFMHYVTSKAAIVGMTRVMARELGDDNINVNAVMPGYTETEVEHASMDDEGRKAIQSMRILKRRGTPDDLIGTVMFLASPASSFITGQSIACCGGEVML